jgi:GH43 family beta-xylosidase
VLVYHARNYTEIEGDPLYDPNRHTRLKLVRWTKTGCLISASRLRIRFCGALGYTSVP